MDSVLITTVGVVMIAMLPPAVLLLWAEVIKLRGRIAELEGYNLALATESHDLQTKLAAAEDELTTLRTITE